MSFEFRSAPFFNTWDDLRDCYDSRSEDKSILNERITAAINRGQQLEFLLAERDIVIKKLKDMIHELIVGDQSNGL